MEKNIQGYVSFVLHAHLPFVHHPESEDYLEEQWLFEAISETYIPLLMNFEKLVEELKPYDFVVNCRGNLVNLRHIEKIKGFNIYLDNGKELQIAQKRSSDFREEVNKFLQKNS